MGPFHFTWEVNLTTMATFVLAVIAFYVSFVRQGDQVKRNTQRIDALEEGADELRKRDAEIDRESRRRYDDLQEMILRKSDDLLNVVTAHATAFSLHQLTIAQDYVSLPRFDKAMDASQSARIEMKNDLLAAIEALGDRVDRILHNR